MVFYNLMLKKNTDKLVIITVFYDLILNWVSSHAYAQVLKKKNLQFNIINSDRYHYKTMNAKDKV